MAQLRRLVTALESAGRRPSSATRPACTDGYEYEIVSASAVITVHGCDTSHGTTPEDRMLALVAGLFRT